MAKGVKKIQMYKGKYYSQKSNSLTSQVTIEPEKWVHFKVFEWLEGTSEEEKQQEIYWLRQSNDRETILFRVKSEGYKFNISKKLSGPYAYYIEASMSGNRDFKNQAGIYVNGYSERLIKSSEWRTQPEGSNIKNGTPIKYGHLVYLFLNTEGLNGDRITIEIYNQAWGDDDFIHRITNVRVKNGEVLLKIGNTSAWMAKINHIEGVEEFYIKAKKGNTYIKDHLGDDKHAIYLNIKKELVTSQTEPAENLTPTKIYQPEISAERYEPCKFDEIIITAPEEKDGRMVTAPVTVFKDGLNLTGQRTVDEVINRTVYFDFNDASIAPDAQKIVNNILGFLLEHKGTRMQMSGYACVIGPEDYNNKLSQQRSDAVKNFFVSGGLDGRRIVSTGRGEYNINNQDDYEKRNEKVYQNARRVDITFTFAAHVANAIPFNIIAPSSKKNIVLDAIGLDAKDCYRDNDKHKKEIIVKSPDAQEFKTSSTSLRFPIQSTLSVANVAPLNYIWPNYNVLTNSDSANIYHAHIHTCRYYSDKSATTVKIKAYPDIKWTLTFFLNLTNDLSVKWQNADASRHRELQEKAGKIGAERRWQQKDASFGFSLKAEWDKQNPGSFSRTKELKQEYETKFKKLYSLFSSVGAMSDGITNKTKGQVRNIGFKGVPIEFAVKPPNLNIEGVWYLEKVEQELGTKVDISFNADPLIGLEVTIDLLCLAVGAVAGAVSGGTASGPAMKLYDQIKSTMNTGIDIGTDDFGFKASSDVFIDLIISSTIKTSVGFEFNTAGKAKDSKFKLEATNTLKIELKAGMWVKGELNLVIVRAEGYFEMSAKGSAAVTFGHGVNYDDEGLYYQPKLGFDGIVAEYVIKGKVGLSSKKKVLGGGTPSTEDEDIIDQGEYTIVEPFNVIESLEELFDFDANIPLIKNT